MEAELTTEQLFELKKTELIVEEMTHEQLKQAFIDMRKYMMAREATFQQLLAKAWGIPK